MYTFDKKFNNACEIESSIKDNDIRFVRISTFWLNIIIYNFHLFEIKFNYFIIFLIYVIYSFL